MKEKTVIVPTSYFGPISYYVLFNKSKLLIEANENYQKRSIRNRCIILSSNGKLNLSVPLQKGKTQKPIQEVKIAYEENWVNNHLTAISSAYGAAPYFQYYFADVKEILERRPEFLLELNNSIIIWLSSKGIINLPVYTESYNKHLEGIIDLRVYIAISTELANYPQVFESKYGFTEDLSILDLLFNLGPETRAYLNQ